MSFSEKGVRLLRSTSQNTSDVPAMADLEDNTDLDTMSVTDEGTHNKVQYMQNHDPNSSLKNLTVFTSIESDSGESYFPTRLIIFWPIY